ncbi:MAG: DUF983 domain-containing protein [Planctomycetes bacterium]|nr:DUF983 domain-containing protein [Planctomycetota bacterium]
MTSEHGGDPWQTFWRGRRLAMRGRCPRCGDGALFASRFRLAKSCDACGLVYRREEGAQTGSMYLCAAVTEVFAALLCVLVFVSTSWSAWTSIAVSLPIVLLFSFWFLPKSMALWVAVEFASDVANREPWTRP